MAWHDSWTAMKRKNQAQPQGQTRSSMTASAVPKRATAKSTAAKASKKPPLPG